MPDPLLSAWYLFIHLTAIHTRRVEIVSILISYMWKWRHRDSGSNPGSHSEWQGQDSNPGSRTQEPKAIVLIVPQIHRKQIMGLKLMNCSQSSARRVKPVPDSVLSSWLACDMGFVYMEDTDCRANHQTRTGTGGNVTVIKTWLFSSSFCPWMTVLKAAVSGPSANKLLRWFYDAARALQDLMFNCSPFLNESNWSVPGSDFGAAQTVLWSHTSWDIFSWQPQRGRIKHWSRG